MLIGLTALSVETMTKLATPSACAILARFAVPRALLPTAAKGLCSISGTCLKAAA
jgi:hypothetical protein